MSPLTHGLNYRSACEGRGGYAMEELDKALANVSTLLIVTAPLIQFGHNVLFVPCKFWGIGTPIWQNRSRVRRGSAMVLLDRALVSSYRLSKNSHAAN